MTLAKRLLLGTAAAFVATSGAHAADLGLPVAPAVEYVQVCSIGAFTGFLLPGTDVCLDISGYARAQYTWGEEVDPFQFSDADLATTGDFLATDDGNAGANLGAALADVTVLGTALADEPLSAALNTFAAGNDGSVAVLLDLLDNTNIIDEISDDSNSAGFSSSVMRVDLVQVTDGAGTENTLYNGDNVDDLLVVAPVAGFAQGDVIEGFGGLMNALLADTGNNDESNFYASGMVSFDARTMTEYGLLRGFIEFDNDGADSVGVDHAYVQLNLGSLGFTAGLTSSVFNPVFTGYGSGATQGLNLNDTETEQFSVNAALGNGVTVSLSVEDDDAREGDLIGLTVDTDTHVLDVYTFDAFSDDYDDGQSIPDLIAAIRVDQAWGSAKLAAALHEVNPEGSTYDSEFGYALSASAEFNLPVGVGSTFGVTGIYAEGAQQFMGFNNVVGNSATGFADAILVTRDDGTPTTSVELTTSYVLAAGFNFGVSNEVSLSLDGSYADVDHYGTIFDGNVMTIRGGVAYTPVNNLTINAHVSYAAADFETDALRSGAIDDDEWGARFRVTRSF